MRLEILHPKPQRPHKRALTDIDSDGLPVSKHARRLSPPFPTPSTHAQRLSSPYPSHSSNSQSLEDLDPCTAPPRKRRRVQSPYFELNDDEHLHITRSASAPPWPACTRGSKYYRPQVPTDSPVDAWISAVTVVSLSPSPISPPISRPSSCPATVDVDKVKRTPPSLETIKQMSQQPARYGENVGYSLGPSQTTRPGTSHPEYRTTLCNNFITLDASGRQMPEELRTFVSTQILKQRESPQLGDEKVSEVIDTAQELADATENADLINTGMFPFHRPGIAKGGNSPWSTVALPNNPEYMYDLSAPKPDICFGYPTNLRSGWSYAQSNVIAHPMAHPYARPARGNTFPFLMVEMKSEAAGGTIYVAENQAAGSGSHSVNALLWLLREAGTYDSSSLTDTIAFSITMSHREAIFYLHWYSEVDRRYYMSFLESYSSVKAEDIRACNNTVKNIIDYGLGARKTAISAALEALFPFPEHWKQAPPPSTAPLTPATSFAANARPSKRRRG